MGKEQDVLKPDFGLIGRDIDYSFSRTYFGNKFEREQLPYHYVNFDLEQIEKFPDLIKNNAGLRGLNVTIPYKESIIPYLDKLSKKARKIGAVNTIKIMKDGRLKGYNTDCYGFEKSLKPSISPHHNRALILGTGGASKAIEFVLNRLNIQFDYVSRSEKPMAAFTYSDLNAEDLAAFQLIINCTPLGTYPEVEAYPPIPYEALGSQHLLYDLVYNPPKSSFLKKGEIQGAQIMNGRRMLELQAEKSFKIWTK